MQKPGPVHFILVVAFHLLPVWPLLVGHYYAAIACVLLVALPYIKERKLAANIADLEARLAGVTRIDPRTQELRDELQAAYRRWCALTLRRPI